MALLAGLEILVEEDVGCGADEFEAHAVAASFTRREVITTHHHHFVAGSMFAVMHDFIDSGLTYRIARTVVPSIFAPATARRPRRMVLLKLETRACERVHHDASLDYPMVASRRMLYSGQSSKPRNFYRIACKRRFPPSV